jgi:hypothetical protein
VRIHSRVQRYPEARFSRLHQRNGDGIWYDLPQLLGVFFGANKPVARMGYA